MCPPLRTARLRLEPLVAAHAEALFGLLSDVELWRYIDAAPPQTVEGLSAYYRRLETRRSPDGAETWLNWLVRTAGGEAVGFAQATLPRSRADAQIAYVIGRPYWSRGWGTEAARAVVDFLTATLRVERIAATVDSRNLASLRLLEKLGFTVADAGDPRDIRLVRTRRAGA